LISPFERPLARSNCRYFATAANDSFPPFVSIFFLSRLDLFAAVSSIAGTLVTIHTLSGNPGLRSVQGLDYPAPRKFIALKREDGATLAALEKRFGWRPHTVRAAVSRLRKSGFRIERCIGKEGTFCRMVELEPGQ